MIARTVALLLVVASSVHGEDRFGQHGQVVPFGSLSFRHTSRGTSSNSVWVGPGVLYFPADSIALGISALYAYTEGIPLFGQTVTLSPGIHSVGFEPILGAAIPVADRVSLFPRFSMRFLWNLPGNGGPSLDLITIRGFAPLLFTLVPHFYIGFGPEFSTDVSTSSVSTKETAFGLATEIGGYF
jgi:hypothetical protein